MSSEKKEELEPLIVEASSAGVAEALSTTDQASAEAKPVMVVTGAALPARTVRKSRKTLPAKTVALRVLREDVRQVGKVEYPEDVARPGARRDCLTADQAAALNDGQSDGLPDGCNAERPCPFVSCRWHLYLDVDEENGSIKFNFPDREVWEIPETCALDIMDRFGEILEKLGETMNLTRERIRQIALSALIKLIAQHNPQYRPNKKALLALLSGGRTPAYDEALMVELLAAAKPAPPLPRQPRLPPPERSAETLRPPVDDSPCTGPVWSDPVGFRSAAKSQLAQPTKIPPGASDPDEDQESVDDPAFADA